MATLTTLQYAVVQDGNGVDLGGGYGVTSSDPLIASIGSGPGGTIAVVGQSVGTATITATRNMDGATATLDVTVTADAEGFSIQLGTPAPKG